MTLHLFVRDLLIWLAIGALFSITVFKRSPELEQSRRRNIFFLLIFLAGPLNIIFGFMPVDTIRMLFLRALSLFEKETPGKLSAKDRVRIITAQREAARAQKKLEETEEYKKYDRAVREIGGQLEP